MRGSTISFFPDVNVWLALAYGLHVHHRVAEQWFRSLDANSGLYFCRLTQIGFLRLLTTAALLGQDVLDQREAWRTYDRWYEDDLTAFVGEPAGLEAAFRDFASLPRPAPKNWVDSYLAAFARASGFTLVTFDRALQQKADAAIRLA